MRTFDGAELCELVGIYILCFLAKLINEKDCGLYRDDGLLILKCKWSTNGSNAQKYYQNI